MIDQLYGQYYQRLLRYCIPLTHDRASAEDIVQDAFVRALANADLLGTMPESKRLAWLYKTARNIFIDQVRRKAKAPKEESGGVFEADLTAVHVAQMLGRLPESERALFSLRYFQGYNASELGEMFGLPPSTVRARLMSARRALRAWIRE